MPVTSAIQLKICGDAKTVVDWINGSAVAKNANHKQQIPTAQKSLAQMWGQHAAIPSPTVGEWVQHQYRRYNDTADKLATIAVLERRAQWIQKPIPKGTSAIQAAFDGGKRGKFSGTGWWIAAGVPVREEMGQPVQIK